LADGSYLLDHAGDGFTAIGFSRTSSEKAWGKVEEALLLLDARFKMIVITPQCDRGSEAFHIYAANEGTVYLLRPDLHIAGRWRDLVLKELQEALMTGMGHGSNVHSSSKRATQ
jgi:3-(3-hydroxy-phenyl)propionate hydroxylase